MFYCVKSRKLATYLIVRGFNIERVDKDRSNPKYDIFLFNKSSELMEAITDFTNELKKIE